MQQKEVLIVVGVLAVGFLLFKSNTFSGQATKDTIYSYPTSLKTIDRYQEPAPIGLSTSETIPCPGSKTVEDINCANWENYMFRCRNSNGGFDATPCHCKDYDSCTRAGLIPTPLPLTGLFTATLNAVNNMGDSFCAGDCIRQVLFSSTSAVDPVTGDLCVVVRKSTICSLREH